MSTFKVIQVQRLAWRLTEIEQPFRNADKSVDLVLMRECLPCEAFRNYLNLSRLWREVRNMPSVEDA